MSEKGATTFAIFCFVYYFSFDYLFCCFPVAIKMGDIIRGT
jgi:hypothetical protein